MSKEYPKQFNLIDYVKRDGDFSDLQTVIEEKLKDKRSLTTGKIIEVLKSLHEVLRGDKSIYVLFGEVGINDLDEVFDMLEALLEIGVLRIKDGEYNYHVNNIIFLQQLQPKE